jgi:RNA polymerase sigma-70 factor (ECF subfamily)
MSRDQDGPGVEDPACAFERSRRDLLRLAYRMLGSVSEAEDVVQEAYLRWHGARREQVADSRAFLSRTVARLCLDYLRSARVRRESYVGPWLPEPWLAAGEGETAAADELTYSLMLALERLSPLERAAFLLHDVFDLDFGQVAGTLGRSETACRQLAARARRHLRASSPRFEVPPEEGQAIAKAFFEASRSGDVARLKELLAETAIVVTDGGGRRSAALNPVLGRDRVIRLFLGLARKAGYSRPPVLRAGVMDGLPSFITVERGGILQTTSIEIDGGLISAVYIVRNPDKLAHLAQGMSVPDVPTLAEPATATSSGP